MKVLGDTPGNGPKEFGPVLTVIVIQVISWAISRYGPALVDCLAKDLGFVHRQMVRVVLLRAFRKSGNGLVTYREHGENVLKGILKCGKEATPDELKALIAN